MATAAAAPPPSASRFPPHSRDQPLTSPWLASTSPGSESTASTNAASPQPASPSQARGAAGAWGVPPHLLQAQARQLRTRRSPLYVPAVLRPTEAPSGTSPPKKREGGGGGGGSGSPGDGSIAIATLSPEADGVASPVSASSIRRMVTEEWNDGSRTEVTGPPSRNHWKPDASSTQCDLAACGRHFSFFSRRHHCRRCGLIFCAEHSSRLVPLDQHARFHDRAPRFRACVDCFGDYGVWAAERARRAAACAPGGGGGADNDGANGDPPAAAAASAIKIGGGKAGGLINSLIAQSVPKDWNWSTF